MSTPSSSAVSRISAALVFWTTAALSYEFAALHFWPKASMLSMLKTILPPLSSLDLSTEPGRPISLVLGYVGTVLMLSTNFYILRKHVRLLRALGELPAWLDFHILGGALGPILIIFHSGFRVGGLVAIAFWAMIIVALSGLVGRYFYTQLLTQKADLKAMMRSCEQMLEKYRSKVSEALDERDLQALKLGAIGFVGGVKGDQSPSLLGLLVSSLQGDLRLLFSDPGSDPALPKKSRLVLKEYALHKRRLDFHDSFRNLLGYWHTFHTPFAVLMYLMAAIHIINALMFSVSSQ